MGIQQRTIEDLQLPQMRFESRIRHAYANVPRAVRRLLSKSEMQIFYNISRLVCGLKPWKAFLAPLLMVARKAALDGRPTVISDTRAAIHEVFQDAEAYVMAALPPSPAIVSVPDSIREETQAQCLSDPDEQELFRDDSNPNIERTLPKLRLHREKLDNTILACEYKLNATPRLGSAIRRPQ